jgi:hypothetical protein
MGVSRLVGIVFFPDGSIELDPKNVRLAAGGELQLQS